MELLTTDEAKRLIELTKISLIDVLSSPPNGESVEFDVSSENTKDLFSINIYRGRINNKKYNYGARIKRNGIILLELHVYAGNIHINPNGEKITGSHWHYYTQEEGLRNAFPAKNVEAADFVENTVLFLKEFHVVKTPEINYQMELF